MGLSHMYTRWDWWGYIICIQVGTVRVISYVCIQGGNGGVMSYVCMQGGNGGLISYTR